MKALQFISHWTDQACRYIMVFFMGLAFLCTIYQVFSRYVLQSSFVMNVFSGVDLAGFNFPWMEELIRYLFVWIVFLGVATVYKLKGHAHVEIVINFLPKAWKRRFAITVELINLVFFAILFIKGLEMLKITNGQLSPSLQFNMAYMYTAIVACSLICFMHATSFLLQSLSSTKRVKELEKHAAPVQPETIG